MRVSVEGRSYGWPAEPRTGAASQPAPPATIWGNEPAVKLLHTLKSLDLFELRLEVDLDLGAIWCFQLHRGSASFAPRLLIDIRKVQRALHDFHREEPADAAEIAKFLVWASDIDDIFNLGGDLKYFEKLVVARDYHRLRAYALKCIDVCFANYSSLNAPMIVAALVAGDALGGGMESALSCDFMVAEEQSKFGLPEMLYGLFPGMGAYSFLMRRVGQARAETLITDGHLRSAGDLAAMGLVDKIAPQGGGREGMNHHLIKVRRRFNASLAIYNARRRSFPISFQEMADIAEEWVSVAMRLTDRELRRMNRLAAAQTRLRTTGRAARQIKSV